MATVQTLHTLFYMFILLFPKYANKVNSTHTYTQNKKQILKETPSIVDVFYGYNNVDPSVTGE